MSLLKTLPAQLRTLNTLHTLEGIHGSLYYNPSIQSWITLAKSDSIGHLLSRRDARCDPSESPLSCPHCARQVQVEERRLGQHHKSRRLVRDRLHGDLGGRPCTDSLHLDGAHSGFGVVHPTRDLFVLAMLWIRNVLVMIPCHGCDLLVHMRR